MCNFLNFWRKYRDKTAALTRLEKKRKANEIKNKTVSELGTVRKITDCKESSQFRGIKIYDTL